ncbi:MAG: chemotaxis protein CheW [Bdellovibrionales bacterium]|nr:chemotaxis protein CheW [Bdellovibrionales bacterium]
MDEILREFLVESVESLDRLDQDFVALEQDPSDKDKLNSIFRSIHTIKGTCGFLNLSKLESLTHIGETLLDSLRAGRRVYDSESASRLLEMVDAVRAMLQAIEANGEEGPEEYLDLKNALRELNGDLPRSIAQADENDSRLIHLTEVVVEEDDQSLTVGQGEEQAGGSNANEKLKFMPVTEQELNQTLENIEQGLAKYRLAAKEEVEPAQQTEQSAVDQLFAEAMPDLSPIQEQATDSHPQASDDHTNHELLAETLGAQPPADQKSITLNTQSKVPSALPQNEVNIEQKPCSTDEQTAVATSPASPLVENSTPSPTQAAARATSLDPGKGLAETSLRVDVQILDKVMNLVGELVLSRNQILQFAKQSSDAGFINTCQRLNLITSELQEGIMQTRMQPIANVWNKFPRIIRDIAKQCGKEIRIEMQGKETDLDKTILEAIKDPLTHVVRNSADHGIESPDLRESLGKPREGVLLLKAYHEGGYVIIEICDDGKGIDAEKVLATAISRGIVSESQAERMSLREIQNLIFAPGLSTAEKVTNVSGRGVGMDVVRSNIEKIGGQIEIESEVGKGTNLLIKIPLTLAIVPALMVTTAGQRFAIPQVNLVELLRVEPGNALNQIEAVKNAYFHRLRGDLLPLVHLGSQLKMQDSWSPHTDSQNVNIVVVRAENRDLGLIVDAVHDTEEIVVKPLGRQLKDVDSFSGATILGDGKVALILDVVGIARHSAVLRSAGNDENLRQMAEKEIEEQRNLAKLLIVGIGNQQRVALPLDLVDRLEEFAISQIERSGNLPVVQYRGGIMPLVDLSHLFEVDAGSRREDVPVVVYSQRGSSFGFIVGSILDIVEQEVNLSTHSRGVGFLGSAVVQGKVTDFLDIPAVIQKALPMLAEKILGEESEIPA